MESLLVGFSPSSAFVSSGSSCWRNKDLMAGHFPILQITGFYKGLQVSRCKVWNIIDRTSVVKLERHHLKHHIRGAKDRSIYHQKIKIKHLANAASGHPLQSNQPDDYKPKSPLNSVINALDAFYRFSRPHTVIGTALSIVSVALLAVEKVSDMSPLFFTGVLEAIAAALMMNIYIVGLNQLSDIEIDKVNKPYLPLASGEYSFKTGVLIVASFSIMSFWLGWIVGSWPLFWALFTSFVLGTAYSINLPLLRWKRFAVAAAMCILAVRAVVVQLAFYLHMQTHVYRRPAVFSKPLIFATAFMSFFSVVIALFKDVPDLEGDKTFGIRTFTVRLGQKRVFWTCISLLEVAYTVAILVGATSPFAWSKLITVLGHSILALILWNRAKSVDIGSKTAITSCYMFIWKLFYTEYLLIPFVR
ncbi:homogentisate phytyltransferase 1 [Citrus sinensis]|uniref:Homogentisate phytyltransferase 1 n=1 Tax=Citrus sinensis TaxID=2711 RepID=A0ACB8P6U6_CITSI|nr:homogentisate phytyltransferase 1 [Citrus sinensis]